MKTAGFADARSCSKAITTHSPFADNADLANPPNVLRHNIPRTPRSRPIHAPLPDPSF